MNIGDLILLHKNSKKTAIIYGNETITYNDLYKLIVYHSKNFSNRITRYKCIGIFLPNSLQYVISYFLIAYLGKVIVPINVNFKSEEILSQIEYCELQLIITDSKHLGSLKRLLHGIKYKITIYVIDKMVFEETCVSGEHVYISDNGELDNVALLLHTSGSLSKPKIVMLTNKNLLACTKSIIESLQISESDKTLIALPLFLASANTSQLLTHIYLGATIVIMDAYFSPKYFYDLVEKHQVTNFTGVPYMMNLLIDSDINKSYNLSSLRFICFGGAPSTTENIRKLIEKFPNVNFIHMYGQTEATTRITHLLPQYSITKIGSVGKPIPGVDLRLVDSKGADVKAGEIGEVIVKGDNVMKGYYKRQKETDEVIKNGWLYTGDLGKFDDDGFLYITGRKRNIIIKGGMNIYPEEIEEILSLHSKVSEVMVVGEKDNMLGELPVAYVVPKSSAKGISSEELIKFCCMRLANYKIPSKIVFVSTLPRTPGGKLKRYGFSII